MAALVANLLHGADEEFHADAFRALVSDFEQRGVRLLISNEALSGSVWRGGLPGDRVAQRLAGVIATADVVIVVRNQPEMLLALYGQYVNEGGTSSLAHFLSGDHKGPPLDHRVLEYDRIVSAYRDAFENRVWVVPYEHVRSDPLRFLGELDERYSLGLGESSLRRVNVSLSPAGLLTLRAWNYLFRASQFNPEPAVTALPGGRRVRNVLQQTIDPPLRRLIPKRTAQAALALVREHATSYAHSNARLAELCDAPLWEIGYPWPTGVR